MALSPDESSGVGRAEAEGQRRFEDQSLAFHNRVRRGYLEQAKANQGWHILDARLPDGTIGRAGVGRRSAVIFPRFTRPGKRRDPGFALSETKAPPVTEGLVIPQDFCWVASRLRLPARPAQSSRGHAPTSCGHGRGRGRRCLRLSCHRCASPSTNTSMMLWPRGEIATAASGPKCRKNSFAIHVAVPRCCQLTQ